MRKAYVLNLDRRPDRRTRFQGWNDHHALDWEWVRALDGRELDRAALVAQGLLAADHRFYPDGAVGNALSHRSQWLECVRAATPRLIFEDDACLRLGFAEQVEGLLTQLAHCDLIYFGYNLDASLVVRLPDDLLVSHKFQVLPADGSDRFMKYARGTYPIRQPNLYPVFMAWGILGYAVSPEGAQRLLNACFPLSSAPPIRDPLTGRVHRPNGMDGMINAALQQGTVRALACVPPLVIGPNDQSDVNACAVADD